MNVVMSGRDFMYVCFSQSLSLSMFVCVVWCVCLCVCAYLCVFLKGEFLKTLSSIDCVFVISSPSLMDLECLVPPEDRCLALCTYDRESGFYLTLIPLKILEPGLCVSLIQLVIDTPLRTPNPQPSRPMCAPAKSQPGKGLAEKAPRVMRTLK